jgi:adenosylcobinamide amidohydrolase
MTAVPLKRLVVVREEAHDVWVEGFFTVGVTNAVRVGEPVSPLSKPRSPTAGTINIVLVTNAALTLSAMVTAVQVVSEAKTAALLDKQIPSSTSDALATGTGTDAVVIVSGHGRRHRYSGTHTKLGELIGKVAIAGVHRGLMVTLRNTVSSQLTKRRSPSSAKEEQYARRQSRR